MQAKNYTRVRLGALHHQPGSNACSRPCAHQKGVAFGESKHGCRHDTEPTQRKGNVETDVRLLQSARLHKDETQDEQRGTNADRKDGERTAVRSRQGRGRGASSAVYQLYKRPESKLFCSPQKSACSLANAAVVRRKTLLTTFDSMTTTCIHLGETLAAAAVKVFWCVRIGLEAELLLECAAHTECKSEDKGWLAKEEIGAEVVTTTTVGETTWVMARNKSAISLATGEDRVSVSFH